MRTGVAAGVLTLGIGFAASALAAEYRWQRVLSAQPRSIEIVQVSTAELHRIERRYGAGGMPRREVLGAAKAHKGFALLYRSGGELYCRVYLVDPADEATRAHERRHCLGWIH